MAPTASQETNRSPRAKSRGAIACFDRLSTNGPPSARLLLSSALFAALGLPCACSSDLPAYAACKSSDECGDHSCFQLMLTDTGSSGSAPAYRQGAFCSARCGVDADCPDKGACYALEGDPDHNYLCFARCESTSDCWEGFECLRTQVRDPATGQTMLAGGICVPVRGE